MVVLALLAGLLAGAAGLAVALGIDITHPPLQLMPPTQAGELLAPTAAARVAAAAATLIGVLVVWPQQLIGGTLMLIGALGMALTFEFQPDAAIPVLLSALAAFLAVYSKLRVPHAHF